MDVQPARPYDNAWDYYAERLLLLDAELHELLDRHRQAAGEETPAAGETEEPAVDRERLRERIERRTAASLEAGRYIPLRYAADLFALTPFEESVVLCALAVELDRKYERLFGYLQDNLQARYATADIALRLFYETEEERWQARESFQPGSKLRRYFIRSDRERSLSLLALPLQLDERMAAFLLNGEGIDPRIEPFVSLHHPADPLQELLVGGQVQANMRSYTDAFYLQPAETEGGARPYMLFFVWGPPGAGKKLQVRHYCRFYKQTVLMVDLRHMVAGGVDFEAAVRQVMLEVILQRALPCFCHFEELLDDNEQVKKKRFHLLDAIKRMPSIVFLLAERQWKSTEPIHPVFVDIALPVPAIGDRVELWKHYGHNRDVDPAVDWGVLASKFRFTPGQIQLAVQVAEQLGAWNRLEARIRMEELHQACYAQTQHKLDTKAKRLAPRYTWDQLILPADQKDELRHACNQMKYRHVVYGQWGFDQRLSYGTGLSMLFSGPPGTGKTMAAEVIAKELYLEIYRIDLSQIISKYIGETEKNLQEIFREAAHSHAILFFDEADALFSKRSEVKDSNDKYANMEVAYLLQKMEEYEGISILATNLQQNIDEAFIRRLTYVIKFPFPNADYREILWRSMIPEGAPQSRLDYKFIAENVEMAGGNIKNIAVSAAFMAAEQGTGIGMRHILQATKYEMKKSGRIVMKERWEAYYDQSDIEAERRG